MNKTRESNLKVDDILGLPINLDNDEIFELAEKLKDENKRLNDEIAEIRIQNENLLEENERNSDLIQELNNRIYDYEMEEQQIEILKTTFNEITIDYDDLKKNNSEKESLISELNEQISKIQFKNKEEMKILSIKISSLEKDLKENNVIKAENKRLEESLLTLNDLKLKADELKLIKILNDKLSKENDEYAKQNKALNTKLDNIQKENDNSQKLLQEYKKKCLELEVDLKDQIDECENYEKLYNRALNNPDHAKTSSKVKSSINFSNQTKNRKKKNTSVSHFSIKEKSNFKNKDLLLCYSSTPKNLPIESIQNKSKTKKKRKSKSYSFCNVDSKLNIKREVKLKKSKSFKNLKINSLLDLNKLSSFRLNSTKNKTKINNLFQLEANEKLKATPKYISKCKRDLGIEDSNHGLNYNYKIKEDDFEHSSYEKEESNNSVKNETFIVNSCEEDAFTSETESINDGNINKKNISRRKSFVLLQDLNLNEDYLDQLLLNQDGNDGEENKQFMDLLKSKKQIFNRRQAMSINNFNPNEDKKAIIDDGNGENNKEILSGIKDKLDILKMKITNLEIEKYKLARQNELTKRNYEKLISDLQISKDECRSYKVLLESIQGNINQFAQKRVQSQSILMTYGSQAFRGKSLVNCLQLSCNKIDFGSTNNYITNSTNYITNGYKSEYITNNNKFDLSKTIISDQVNFSFISVFMNSEKNVFSKFDEILQIIIEKNKTKDFHKKNTLNLDGNKVDNLLSEKQKTTGIKSLDCNENFSNILNLNKELVVINKSMSEEIDRLEKLIDKIERDNKMEKDKLLYMVYKLSIEFDHLKSITENYVKTNNNEIKYDNNHNRSYISEYQAVEENKNDISDKNHIKFSVINKKETDKTIMDKSILTSNQKHESRMTMKPTLSNVLKETPILNLQSLKNFVEKKKKNSII